MASLRGKLNSRSLASARLSENIYHLCRGGSVIFCVIGSDSEWIKPYSSADAKVPPNQLRERHANFDRGDGRADIGWVCISQ